MVLPIAVHICTKAIFRLIASGKSSKGTHLISVVSASFSPQSVYILKCFGSINNLKTIKTSRKSYPCVFIAIRIARWDNIKVEVVNILRLFRVPFHKFVNGKQANSISNPFSCMNSCLDTVYSGQYMGWYSIDLSIKLLENKCWPQRHLLPL